MPQAAWGLLVAALPLLAVALVKGWPGRAWDARVVPADAFRFVTVLGFAWAVDLTFGVLATLAAGWWALAWWQEVPWEQAATGTLWPTVAAAAWLGRSAPDWVLDGMVTVAVVVGVIETALMVGQRAGWRWAYIGAGCHGTFGHRVAAGLYLALVAPLMPAVGLLLGIGVVLSRSFAAASAWAVGMLVVWPQAWLPIALLGGAGLAYRMVKRQGGTWRLRKWSASTADTPWDTRYRVWRQTVTVMAQGGWLFGRGPGSFARTARRWPPGSEIFSEAHNDYLEFAFEYGAVGLLAVGWWLWRFGDFGWGDPLTGSAAALGVGMVNYFPLKVTPLACVGLLVGLLLMRRVA